VLAPLAPSMRDAVRRAACSSSLGAAQVLAPPASTVRLAVPRLRLPGPFSASFQCYSLTSWGEG
jgi:hypothetical protein